MEGDLFTPDTTEFTLEFQSTPSAWRETSKQCPEAPPAGYFNPLPPHGGRPLWLGLYTPPPISIHSLRMEGDREISRIVIRSRYFNPLPPHGGRQRNDFSDIYHSHISIHSLRMEGDQGNSADYRGIMEFQSTPSAWRETQNHLRHEYTSCISIHSLRMEGDMSFSRRISRSKRISIHSLRMEGDSFWG